jgi:hypothetical protein
MNHAHLSPKLLALLASGLALALAASPARADSITSAVTVSTTALSGVTGPFELYFQLNDGSQTGDGNNSVTLSNFSFGGGAAGAIDTGNSYGAYSDVVDGLGNFTSLSLTDTQAFNGVLAFFAPGSQISFELQDTFSSIDTPTPDEFGFAIVANGVQLATTDPTGGDSLADLTFDSATPTVYTYGIPSAVPEPPTLILAFTGLLLAGFFGLRRRAAGRARA